MMGVFKKFEKGKNLNNGRHTTIFLCLALFSGMLIWVYVTFLTRFSYMGFTYDESSNPYIFLSLVLLFLSSLLLPIKINKLSDSTLWFIYWILYAPIVLLVPLQSLDIEVKASFLFSIWTSFLLMVLASHTRISLGSVKNLSRPTFFTVFFFTYFLLNAYIFYIFGGRMQIVGFDEIYDLRSQNDFLQNGTLVGYVSGILAWAFNPFLLSIGLIEKKKLFVLLGLFGQIFLYSTLGHKGVLFTAIIILFFYYFFIKFDPIRGDRLAWLMVVICLIPLVPYLLIGMPEDLTSGDGMIFGQVISMVYMRSFGMVAAMMGAYINFFQENQYILYSHINIVSLFIDYPYERSIGEIIGYDLVNAELNANASFFATDGYASLGNIGVIIIGPIVGLFFSIANAMTKNSLRTACLSFIPFVMILSNGSFFTALLTGGGLFLLIFIYFSNTLDGKRD